MYKNPERTSSDISFKIGVKLFKMIAWNPWKWGKWTYLRGKNRGINVENRLVGTGVGRLGLPGRSYSHTPVRRTDSWWELLAQGPRLGAVVTGGGTGAGRLQREGGHRHACGESSHRAAETSTALQSKYVPVFKKKKNTISRALLK